MHVAHREADVQEHSVRYFTGVFHGTRPRGREVQRNAGPRADSDAARQHVLDLGRIELDVPPVIRDRFSDQQARDDFAVLA